MNDFYKSSMGRKFYETDMPKLINVLEKIASKMDEANRLEERRFKLEEKLLRGQLKDVNERLKDDRADK